MKQPIYTIGNNSIGFSLESIKKRYSNREDFIADVRNAHAHIEKEELDKVLNKVCDEVFPKEEMDQKEKIEIEPKPSRKGKSNQEGAE